MILSRRKWFCEKFSLTLFQIGDTMTKIETDNNYDLIKTEKRWFYDGAFADP